MYIDGNAHGLRASVLGGASMEQALNMKAADLQAKQISEIDREMGRLANAEDVLRKEIEVLASRLQMVLSPQPTEKECGSAQPIDSCQSQLGEVIQCRALGLMQAAEKVRRITALLAL